MTPRIRGIVRACFWVSLALAVGSLLNWARTGHLLSGILITGATTSVMAAYLLRTS